MLKSKINWTQLAAVGFAFATELGYVVPEELKSETLTAVAAIAAVVTIVLRTWFNKPKA